MGMLQADHHESHLVVHPGIFLMRRKANLSDMMQVHDILTFSQRNGGPREEFSLEQ
jgi:hypothetical protein